MTTDTNSTKLVNTKHYNFKVGIMKKQSEYYTRIFGSKYCEVAYFSLKWVYSIGNGWLFSVGIRMKEMNSFIQKVLFSGINNYVFECSKKG